MVNVLLSLRYLPIVLRRDAGVHVLYLFDRRSSFQVMRIKQIVRDNHIVSINGMIALINLCDSIHVMHAIIPEKEHEYSAEAVPISCVKALMPALLVKGIIRPRPKHAITMHVMCCHGMLVLRKMSAQIMMTDSAIRRMV